MDVVSITINDKKSVTIEYEDGRKVKYLYNHIVSENPDIKNIGVQMELRIQEIALSGSQIGNSR